MGIQGQDFSVLASIYSLERTEDVYQDLADGMEGETSRGEVGVPIYRTEPNTPRRLSSHHEKEYNGILTEFQQACFKPFSQPCLSTTGGRLSLSPEREHSQTSHH